MTHNQNGLVLQKIYSTMSHNLQLQNINQYYPQNPEILDQLVSGELKRLQHNYALDEEKYVDQMMSSNPIVVERRPSPRSATPNAEQDQSQIQRAESCRRSRINNKVKKAKMRHRHRFASGKLQQSVNTLENIRKVIAQAEIQLLRSGYNRSSLERMRNTFGVDRNQQNLSEIMHMMETDGN